MEKQNKDPGTAGTVSGAKEGKHRKITPTSGESKVNGSAGKPHSHAGNLRALPPALAPLLALRHWVLWRWERSKKGKWTKVPYQPSGTKAKNNDPKTWSTYAAVLKVLEDFDGIGFCLFNSGYAAFDIDDCRDPTTGIIDPWALNLVARAGSYTEITVSGTGLRIIGFGEGPKVQRKQPAINGVSVESYRKAERYIVMTGNPLPDSPPDIVNIDTILDEVVAELDAQKKEEKKKNGQDQAASPAPSSDDDLDDLIRNGVGERFDGDRSRGVWYAIHEMIRRGYLREKIRSCLLDQRNRISDHIYDQTNPEQYLDRQLTKAEKEITFTINDKGQRHPNQGNIRIALLKLKVQLRYDEFNDRITLSG